MRRARFQSNLLLASLVVASSIAVISAPADAKRIKVGISSGGGHQILAQNAPPSEDTENTETSTSKPSPVEAKSQEAINKAAAERARKVLAAEEAGDTVTTIGGQINTSANAIVCVAGCYK